VACGIHKEYENRPVPRATFTYETQRIQRLLTAMKNDANKIDGPGTDK
jgi:hypothetical protein